MLNVTHEIKMFCELVVFMWARVRLIEATMLLSNESHLDTIHMAIIANSLNIKYNIEISTPKPKSTLECQRWIKHTFSFEMWEVKTH